MQLENPLCSNARTKFSAPRAADLIAIFEDPALNQVFRYRFKRPVIKKLNFKRLKTPTNQLYKSWVLIFRNKI